MTEPTDFFKLKCIERLVTNPQVIQDLWDWAHSSPEIDLTDETEIKTSSMDK